MISFGACAHLVSLATDAPHLTLKRKLDGPLSAAMEDAKSDDGSVNKKKKPLTNERREERNMREKERSLKITQQIHELRELLSLGGIIVPKVSVRII